MKSKMRKKFFLDKFFLRKKYNSNTIILASKEITNFKTKQQSQNHYMFWICLKVEILLVNAVVPSWGATVPWESARGAASYNISMKFRLLYLSWVLKNTEITDYGCSETKKGWKILGQYLHSLKPGMSKWMPMNHKLLHCMLNVAHSDLLNPYITEKLQLTKEKK